MQSNDSVEAATIPLVSITAAITVFRRQHLPPPWAPATAVTPLIVYGASSALGTFALKLAKAANIHPLIAIAGSSTSHLTSVLDSSKGDILVDYRVGNDEMIKSVREKLNGAECHHAIDCITSNGSPPTWVPLSQMLTPSTESQKSYLSVVSGANKYDETEIPAGVDIVYTFVGTAHAGAYRPNMPKQADAEEVKGDPEWTKKFFSFVERSLEEGKLAGHPYEIVPGGLGGIEKGLTMLKEGKARGKKFVFRVAESDE